MPANPTFNETDVLAEVAAGIKSLTCGVDVIEENERLHDSLSWATVYVLDASLEETTPGRLSERGVNDLDNAIVYLLDALIEFQQKENGFGAYRCRRLSDRLKETCSIQKGLAR